MNAIRQVQGQISHLLEEHLEIATTPGMELTERVKHQESEISALKRDIESAQAALGQERQRTRDALESAAQKDAKIDELQKENNLWK